MTGLLVALLLSQGRGTPPAQTQRPGVTVSEAGTIKGRATTVDFASGATVTVTGTTASVAVTGGGGGGGAPTTAQYWTGAADGTLSAEKNLGALGTGLVLNTGGVPSAYAGATCAAPGFVRVISASGAATCASLRLDQLVNPTGDTAFAYPSGTKMLWTFTGSTDEAFTIHGDGAFTGTGDLVHIHKSGTGSSAGADALHVEVDADTNMAGVHITMANATRTALTTNALVSAAGFTGPLTGNASTATALAANPANCGAGQAAGGIAASGAAESCVSVPAASGGAGVIQVSDGSGGLAAFTSSTCGANTYATASSSFGALTCGQVSMAGLNATGTPSGTTYLRGDGTWSTPAGGGGSPGGSTTQVQYNNAGAFGGMSRVTTDGADLILTGSTTEPSAPAAGYTKLYGAQPHGSNGPVLPFWKGGATQVDYRLFPEMRSADPVWGCLQPGAHGSTTITPAGSIIAGSATGTPATVAWAATDERTRAKWVQYPAASAAVNLNAGLRAGVDYVWRGNAAGIGGFYVWGTFNIVTANAGQRVFAGIKDSTAVITAASDPNVTLDTVYFGANAADTNLSICSNDNSGTATCTTLGANFPKATANTAYDWALWAQPNGSSIGYYIRRLVNGSEAQGTISTDLPRNTVALGWDMTINSGTTAAIATMQFGGVCYIANP